MPIPTLVTDLSTTAGSNSPAGSESPVDGDNYIRALSAFVASLAAGSATNGYTSPYLLLTGGTLTGALRTPDGSAAAPAIGIGEAATGLYRVGAGQLGVSVGGTLAASWSANRNLTFTAPASGTSMSILSLTGQVALYAGIAGAANNPRLELSATEATGLTNLNITSSSGTALGRISLNGTAVLDITAARNVTLGAPSSGATLTIGQVAGTNALDITVALSGSTLSSQIFNTSNTASSDARQYIITGGSSAGDPYTRYQVAGVTDASIGLDNSDSDAFVISLANTLGTSNRLRMVPGGVTELLGATSGSFSLSTLGVGTFSGAVSMAGLTANGFAYTPTNSQAFSATPTFNAALSNHFEMGAMTANVTSVTITNPLGGQTITIRFLQDGTGGRTVATPSGAKILGSVASGANLASLLTLTYSTAAARWEGSYLQVPA